MQIAERRLSRKHCEIVRMDGIYFVKDLGSQNGTYVNRKRIQDIHELRMGMCSTLRRMPCATLPTTRCTTAPTS